MNGKPRAIRESQVNGFTLVEFIVVALVIGILASVTMSRFIRGSAMNGVIIRDQVVAFSRAMQQNALGRQDVSLEIKPNPAGTTVTLTSSDINGEIQSQEFISRGFSLSGDINETDSCATTNGGTALTNTNYLVINFNKLGNLGDSGIAGSEAAIDSALRICINNDPDLSVCVSPSGFAYAGDCDG